MILSIIVICLAFVLLKIILDYGNHAKNVLSTMSIQVIPNSIPFFGNALSFFNAKHIGDGDIINSNKYGNIYGLCEFYTPVVVIKDLELLKDVLIKKFNSFTDRRKLPVRGWMKSSLVDETGENWKRIRSIMTPFFSTLKLKNCMPALQDCIKVYLTNIENLRLKDSSINISMTSSSLTFDVILSTAFGVHVDSQNDSANPVLKVLSQVKNLDLMNPLVLSAFMFPFLSPIYEFFGLTMFPRGYLKYFEVVANDLIEQRSSDPKRYHDFLDVLVKNADNLKSENEEKGLKLSKTEIYAQMLIFFLAGYDTTSKTLSFVLYLLAIHPDIQDKLLNEINSNLEHKEPDFENINKVEYLEAVISETLRLYPAVYRFDRMASEDVKIGNGIEIKKGVSITVPIWAIHYDPEIWMDPHDFNPERFTGENKIGREVCSFLPFGLGLRSCIGIRFAHLVLKIAIVRLLRSYQFSRSDKTEVPIELLSSGLFLQPVRDIFLKVEPRIIK